MKFPTLLAMAAWSEAQPLAPYNPYDGPTAIGFIKNAATGRYLAMSGPDEAVQLLSPHEITEADIFRSSVAMTVVSPNRYDPQRPGAVVALMLRDDTQTNMFGAVDVLSTTGAVSLGPGEHNDRCGGCNFFRPYRPRELGMAESDRFYFVNAGLYGDNEFYSATDRAQTSKFYLSDLSYIPNLPDFLIGGPASELIAVQDPTRDKSLPDACGYPYFETGCDRTAGMEWVFMGEDVVPSTDTSGSIVICENLPYVAGIPIVCNIHLRNADGLSVRLPQDAAVHLRVLDEGFSSDRWDRLPGKEGFTVTRAEYWFEVERPLRPGKMLVVLDGVDLPKVDITSNVCFNVPEPSKVGNIEVLTVCSIADQCRYRCADTQVIHTVDCMDGFWEIPVSKICPPLPDSRAPTTNPTRPLTESISVAPTDSVTLMPTDSVTLMPTESVTPGATTDACVGQCINGGVCMEEPNPDVTTAIDHPDWFCDCSPTVSVDSQFYGEFCEIPVHDCWTPYSECVSNGDCDWWNVRQLRNLKQTCFGNGEPGVCTFCVSPQTGATTCFDFAASQPFSPDTMETMNSQGWACDTQGRQINASPSRSYGFVVLAVTAFASISQLY